MLEDAGQVRGVLSDQEQQLLDLVRQGKVDAEIAVRLGISNAEVKARLERLSWKLRARDRDELRASEPEQALGSIQRAMATAP